MLGSIGMPELILIFVIALIVFGPKKLPEIGKSLGKGLAEFKRASDDLKQNIQKEVDSLQAEVKPDIKPEVKAEFKAEPPAETVQKPS
jgi:sec-independent protein translocase protein TatA